MMTVATARSINWLIRITTICYINFWCTRLIQRRCHTQQSICRTWSKMQGWIRSSQSIRRWINEMLFAWSVFAWWYYVFIALKRILGRPLWVNRCGTGSLFNQRLRNVSHYWWRREARMNGKVMWAILIIWHCPWIGTDARWALLKGRLWLALSLLSR